MDLAEQLGTKFWVYTCWFSLLMNCSLYSTDILHSALGMVFKPLLRSSSHLHTHTHISRSPLHTHTHTSRLKHIRGGPEEVFLRTQESVKLIRALSLITVDLQSYRCAVAAKSCVSSGIMMMMMISFESYAYML